MTANDQGTTLDRKRLPSAVLALIAAAWSLNAAAQSSASSDDWRQTLDIYLLAPTIEGTTGIGPTDTDVDVDAETVFDTLQGAFLAMYAAEKETWGVFADIVYMDLEADIEGPNGLVTGELGNKQFTGALAGTRRMNEHWQLMAGAMYTDITLSLDTQGPMGDQRRRRSESWVDPFIGARFETPLGEKWGFGAFGYWGGWGVGSDAMWSVNAGFGYRFGEHNGITLLYRYIDFNYEDGEGLDRFRFDIAEHGPALGWRIRF